MKESVLYQILKPFITIFFMIIFHPRVKGYKKIKKLDHKVLVGNHTSIMDCLLLISVFGKPIHFMAKVELFKGPFRFIFKNTGLIPVDRSKKNPEAVKLAIDYVNSNMNVLVFPEGTTEKGRGLLPFKIGAFKVASETDGNLIPFVITGKYIPLINNLKIEFFEPVKISKGIEKTKDEVYDLIEKKLGV